MFNVNSCIRTLLRVSAAWCLVLFSSIEVLSQEIDATARKQLFDYDWKFYLGDTVAAKQKSFDDSNWRLLHLPHDWSIEGKVDSKNPTGNAGGYFPAGTGWYRKTFNVPAELTGKKVALYLEGVYMNAETFINGTSLGEHPYGYTSFTYDLTPYLQWGKENVIAVKVDNSQQINSRWYSGSGIYRHVWMIVTDAVHIAPWGVSVTAPVISSKKATVLVKTLVKNETNQDQHILVKTALWNQNKKNAGNSQLSVKLAANTEKEVIQTITVSNPSLWTNETPSVYVAHVQLLKHKKAVDDCKTNFGIRSLNYSVENGFRLNGKMIKLNGGCVHHDNGCIGSAAYDRAEEKKVEILKAAGFNAVRTSHNPPSEAFLDACDRLGLLVIDESFDCWRIGKNKNDYARYFDKWWQQDLAAMVLRDRNHPSIIMWSIGNEVPERGTPAAVQTAEMLISAVKKMDTTRPVTSAVVENGKDWTVMDSLMAVHDVAGYNYHLYAAPADHQRVPSRMIVQTESYPKDAFANWNIVQSNRYVLGDFVWTAIDYLGEAGIGRYYYSGDAPGENWERDLFPWHGAYCGDIDLTGWRKPISHYRSMLYNDNEKLYIAVREPAPAPLEIKETWWSVWPTWQSWNWPGFEGKPVQVEVYSKYPKVRLYLNNTLVGEELTTREQQFKATFTLPYTAGVLKAVAVENDRETETTILQTAGEAANIKLTADRKQLSANGQDLSYITVEIIDKEGVIQSNATNQLLFKIKGAGTIAGICNADLKDWNQYTGNTCKTWKGRALVVIKSSQSPGDIELTVSSPGLPEVNFNIKSIQSKSLYAEQ